MAARIIKIITSFFGLGYAPLASGTFGSLGGAVLFLLFGRDAWVFFAVTIFITFVGFISCRRAEEVFGKKDPSKVVIDEVSGMMISLLFLPLKTWVIIIAFLLFRIFDILKPPPCRWLEKLPGSYGIMLDDVAAGIYANMILQIVVNVQKSLH